MIAPADRVRVELAARTYDVRIAPGLLADAGRLIRETVGAVPLIVVADAGLNATPHLARLHDALADAGLDAAVLEVPSGEASKSLATYGKLLDEALALGPDRRTAVVAVGGGVIGDLAGFVAATLLRGLRLIQIPTTLLAQVDSAVGGKTGINSRHGKNLIGAFHQPVLVLADLDTLATLPPRERRAGYAEVVKCALLGDAPFFDWLEAHGPRALAGNPDALQRVVHTAVALKARIVAADEEERTDQRALLNLGHTFAHAYERLVGYDDRLLHGEAVALGLVLAADLSARLGLCPAGHVARIRAHLAAVGLPTRPGSVTRFEPEAVLAAMASDKKAVAGQLTFIVLHGIGDARVLRGVDRATVLAVLRDAT